MSYLDYLPPHVGDNVLYHLEMEKRKRRGKCNRSKIVLNQVGERGYVHRITNMKCGNMGSLKLTICDNGIRHSPLYFCALCAPDIGDKSGKAYYYRWNHKKCKYDDEAYKEEELKRCHVQRRLHVVI